MTIVRSQKHIPIATGTDYARRWLLRNEEQLICLAMLAETVLGSIALACVTAWHPQCRDFGYLLGDNPSKRPILGNHGGMGSGFQFFLPDTTEVSPGVATVQERYNTAKAVRGQGFEMEARRIERPPLGQHTLTVVLFLDDRAEIHDVTVTRPTTPEASNVVLGN